MKDSDAFNPLFYWFVRNSFLVIYTIYNRLSIRGRENIPRGETLIIASNHASNIDPPLIGASFPGPLRYLAKEQLFSGLLGTCIRALGAVPVRREDSARAGAALRLMLDRLAGGKSVLVFPEGSRTKDGRIGAIEGGAAFLSVRSGARVLPVYIGGSFAAFPSGAKFPRPAKLTVTFAPPIAPPPDGTDRERRDALTRELDGVLRRLEAEAAGGIQTQ